MKLFQEKPEDNPWMSISDLMSVLMMVFLFVSITYMIKITIDKKRIETIAVTYESKQTELYKDLAEEFRSDLGRWNAVLDTATLSVRFEEPDVLFEVGSSQLKENFKQILDDFFPRYLKILTQEKYKNDIEEIRIEGHTSSEWEGESFPRKAYFNNMELSQDRTRKVLEYLLSNISDDTLFDWTKTYVTANGLSSSKPILTSVQEEDKPRSRRVEFRVRTNAEKQILKILQSSQD